MIPHAARLMFVANVAVMIVFSVALYRFLFSGSALSLHLVMLEDVLATPFEVHTIRNRRVAVFM